MKTRITVSGLALWLLLGSVERLEAQLRIFGNRRDSQNQQVNPAHERAKMEAEQAYERGEYQRSIDLASSVLRQNPRDDVAYYLRAGARVELGLVQNNPQLIRSGVADARESIRFDRKNTVMYYLPYLYGMTNLATIENRKEHAEISVKVAGQILARRTLKSDDKANLLYQRAMASIFLQSFEKAARDYEAAIKLQRNHLGAYLGLADAYSQAGNTSKALEAYGRAVETFPDTPLVYNNRGMYLQQLEKHEEAITDFTRAIELEPDYFYAYTNRGYTLLQSGDAVAAEADFSKSLQINSNQSTAYSLRSSSRLLQGKIKGALSDQSQAVRLTPRDPAAHADLGFVSFFSGDYNAAERSFAQSLKLDPTMRHLKPWQYLTREFNGQTTEAKKKFSPDLKPDSRSRDWIDHLMAYLLGSISDAELLKAVSTKPPEINAAQLCEAHYFIGLRKHRSGSAKIAQQHFQKAVQTKATYLSAYRGAQVALKKFSKVEDVPSR
ncbi:MAG: tetratricopeptide repeat protein [Planctomycetes bacterium]|nr:tetratricopeptide repeat protein [Planctomycetota bacterium]